MNKKMVFILLVIVVLSVLLSACSTDDISGSILSVPMGSSEIERMIDSAIESSCPTNPDGTCKLMGAK